MILKITIKRALLFLATALLFVIAYWVISNWTLIKILTYKPVFYPNTEVVETWSLETSKYAITGATLYRDTSTVPIQNALIIIEEGKIIYADSLNEEKLSGIKRVIDASGKTIIPGLIDGHVHLNKGTDMHLFLAAGVTTVRDVGNSTERLQNLNRISQDHVAPRIFYSGELLRGPGGHPTASFHIVVEDSLHAMQEIDRLIGTGASLIKLTGNLSPEMMRVICNRAKAENLPIAIDFLGTKSISGEMAIHLGANTIEHGGGIPQSIHNLNQPLQKKNAIMLWLYADTTKASQLMDLMVEKGTYLSPTFVVLRSGALSDQSDFKNSGREFVSDQYQWYDDLFSGAYWDRVKDPFLIQYVHLQKFTYEFYKKGGKIMAGTDLPAGKLVPGFSLQDELAELHHIGLDHFDVIKSATFNNAEALGKLDEIGTLEKGKWADLLILRNDPMIDVSNIETLEWVIKGGVVYDPEKILALNRKKLSDAGN